MRSTFSQKFEQQQILEEQVSKKYGYQITKTSPQPIKQTSSTPEKIITINRSIKPLVLDKRKPIPSQKHLELIKEIAENQHQRRMRRIADQREDGYYDDQDLMKKMNDRVKQYNYLIDHKHIKDKNSQDTKRVLKLKPKSEAEKIVDQIKLKNKQLMQTFDINMQFKLNKTIAQLYKNYKDKMYDDVQINHEKLHQTLETGSNTARKTIKSQIRTKSIGSQQGKPRNYSDCMSKVRIKHEQEENCEVMPEDHHQNQNQNEKINLKEPFIAEEEIRKNNELQRKIQNNKQFIDMYKFKITTLKNFYKQQPKSRKTSSKKKSRQKTREYSWNKELQIKCPELDQSMITQLRQKRLKQIKYFSSFLEKRNRKYKKPWGNKILIKYDSSLQAKNMLEGAVAAAEDTLHTTHYLSASNYVPFGKNTISSSFNVMPNTLDQEDQMILDSMREEERDPKLYETMCKNEKVNLFLKAAKRNK